ncbi:cupin domain-containing protein [Phenylobacterium sp.]|jgi:uncharacterized cupin superfamily protein|uniref:cupin domain-containing protein n=1 Tax=Phenylobacterium sp. TaxID=1871053 RepID=UPI002F931676
MIVFATTDPARLQPAPIRPEWILEGAPLARSAELSRSPDGTAMTALWDCTAGAFNWFFAGDETVHIVEGEVIVEDEAGVRTLRPGDVALFPAGTWARWTVPRYVRKVAFCRDPLPRPVLKLVQLVRAAKRRLKRQPAPSGPLGLPQEA